VTVSLSSPTQEYPFSSIAIPNAVNIGIGGVNDVRQASYLVAVGQKILVARPIEWFITYYLGQPVPQTGAPKTWAQRGQGQFGTILFAPVPDGPYVCPLEVDAFPVQLVDDTTPEAIPPLWQDAVPFYAAWLALQQLQRQADADLMIKRFQEQMNRARAAATPDILPDNYEQAPDLTLGNRLGMTRGQ
jgi:hypothetical protein